MGCFWFPFKTHFDHTVQLFRVSYLLCFFFLSFHLTGRALLHTGMKSRLYTDIHVWLVVGIVWGDGERKDCWSDQQEKLYDSGGGGGGLVSSRENYNSRPPWHRLRAWWRWFQRRFVAQRHPVYGVIVIGLLYGGTTTGYVSFECATSDEYLHRVLLQSGP